MKTLFSFPLLLLTALLSGCVGDDENSGKAPKGNGRVLTVNYSFDTPATRVTATGDERRVNDVAILFYKADANVNNESYVACLKATPPTGNYSGSFALTLPDEIQEGVDYKLILIGNYESYAPDGKSLSEYAEDYDDFTYTNMRKEVSATLEASERVTTPLPFYGRLLGADDEETVLTAPGEDDEPIRVSIRFSRSVSRFDLINRVPSKLRIEWVKVCNYRSQGYYYHENMVTGVIIGGISNDVPSTANGYTKAPEPEDGQQNITWGGLYAFPNAVSYTAQNDKLTTFLMIAGRYEDSDELTYYRVNASINGASQMLQRNYIYTIVINGVKGPGAGSEEEASNEEDQLINYIIDNEWDDNLGGTTVTDKDGNFLYVARTNVALPATAGSSVVIGVDVKETTDWELVWDENPGGAFSCQRINNTSFSITATTDNNTLITKNAKLRVRVTEVESDLKILVNVVQLSANGSAPALLIVDGQVGELEYEVPGQGGSISLPVVTGDTQSRWKLDATNTDLNRFLKPGYPAGGVNNGTLYLEFSPNVSGKERSGYIIIQRLLPNNATAVDNSVAPVKITFKQNISPYRVTVLFPEGGVETGEPIEIDGFDPIPGLAAANGIVTKDLRFQVQLADPTNYTSFTVTSSFHSGTEAFLTVSSKDASNTKASYIAKSTESSPMTLTEVTANGNTYFYLNVFRTGPGDATINGEITVTAKGKDANYPNETYTFPVSIITSCNIGDSQVGGYIWADRNVGATSRTISVGLNYSGYTNSADNVNSGFKGTLFVHRNGNASNPFLVACTTFGKDNGYTGTMATGWFMPDTSAFYGDGFINQNLCFSKGRAFVVSQNKSQGKVGCWFPLYQSGGAMLAATGQTSATAPIYGGGLYWASNVTNMPQSARSYNRIDFDGHFGVSSSTDSNSGGTATSIHTGVVRCMHRL